MKKLDSSQDKDSFLEELKHLHKENKKLASQKDKIKAKYDKTKKELKKRRSEDNIDRRTKSITLEPVHGHRFPLVVIQLCVLIYMRTPCGLRTVVTILEIFAELLGDTFGKVPCYNTIENWVKKLGLSVYQDEQPCKDKKFAMVVDESIAINGQKLLLTLAIPSEHQNRPIRHEDVTILDISVSKGFNGDDVQGRIEEAEKSAGNAPDYIISDNGHNLTKGITGSRHIRHADISHSMGVILKKVYEKQSDFVEFTTLLGKKRLQYHLTDKAYLLPPNMRAISRFMNMSSWVFWGNEMLDCYDTLPEKIQEAYAFIKDYESLLKEL